MSLRSVGFAVLVLALGRPAVGETLSHLTFEPGEFSWSDSVRFFQGAKGGVHVTDRMAARGDYALELADEPGDSDFPELLARFTPRQKGVLDIHFALLPTDREVFQVALAGPRLFTLQKDGFSIWLRASGGVMTQLTDGIPKRLVEIVPHRWHYFTLRVDLNGGRYDLEVRREGEKAPIATVRGAWNAVATPGVAVDRLSFISEPGDRSSAHFFVDEVSIDAGDGAVAPRPVAWGEHAGFAGSQSSRATSIGPGGAPAPGEAGGAGGLAIAPGVNATKGLGCPPAFTAAELGLATDDLARLRAAGVFGTLENALLDAPDHDLASGVLTGDPAGRAFAAWVQGCAALGKGNAEVAAKRFGIAVSLRPTAWLPRLTLALAEARLGHASAADAALLAATDSERFRDRRYAAVVSEVARLLRSLESARAALPRPEAFLASAPPAGLAEFQRVELARRTLEGLKLKDTAAFTRLVGEVLISEQLYCVLGENDSVASLRFAEGMRNRLRAAGIRDARWSERAGDAAFALGDAARAGAAYRDALSNGGNAAALWGKLARVAELGGDIGAAATARAQAVLQK